MAWKTVSPALKIVQHRKTVQPTMMAALPGNSRDVSDVHAKQKYAMKSPSAVKPYGTKRVCQPVAIPTFRAVDLNPVASLLLKQGVMDVSARNVSATSTHTAAIFHGIIRVYPCVRMTVDRTAHRLTEPGLTAICPAEHTSESTSEIVLEKHG